MQCNINLRNRKQTTAYCCGIALGSIVILVFSALMFVHCVGEAEHDVVHQNTSRSLLRSILQACGFTPPPPPLAAIGTGRHYRELPNPNQFFEKWRSGHLSIHQIVLISQHPESSIREEAVHALGLIQCPTKDVVNRLIQALSDDDCLVRRTSAWALGRFGKAAENATPHLRRLENDNAGMVRRAAANAMQDIQGEMDPKN